MVCPGYMTVKALATDHLNNSVVAGSFNFSANFGAGSVPSVGYDGFIAKYTPQNTLAWAIRIGGGADDVAYAVAIDSRDNIIVSGFFGGTVDFGGTTLTATPNPFMPSTDIFVAKYSPAGTLVWAKNFGGDMYDMGTAVGIDTHDGSDNVILAASFQSTANFGGVSLTCNGGKDMALVKLSAATGGTIWAKGRGSSADETPNGLAVDRWGDVVVTGQATGATDLGGGLGNNKGVFVAKYSGATGNYQWGRAMGTDGNDAGYGVATHPTTGNIVVTGKSSGTANFGGGTVGAGIFLAALDASGNSQWVKTFGSSSSDIGYAVSIDATTGNIALTGQVTSMVDFGGGWLFSNGNWNYFVASYSSSGTYQWAKRAGLGSAGASSGSGIAFDSNGHLLAAGFYNSTVDLGGILTTSLGFQDGFVVQYTK
jgi:hypothetical protein